MVLSDMDYKDYQSKRISAYHLAVQYGVSITTMYKHIREMKGTVPWTRMSQQDREALREDLANTVPHSKDLSVSSVLDRYGIRTIGNALALLKVSSMSELRYGNKELIHTLRTLKLTICNNMLYARGNRHTAAITLTPEELASLADNPKQWLKDNITRVRALYSNTGETL